MNEPTPIETPPTPPDPIAAPIPGLFHLTGSRRGTTETLIRDTVRIGTAADTEIHLPADREPAVAPLHATLHRRGGTYQLRAEPGRAVRVNGEPVQEMVLASGDVIRLGEGGPRLRFRLFEAGQPGYRSMAEVLADCAECAQEDGATPLASAGLFLKSAPWDLATQTSPRFRLTAAGVLLLAAFAALAAYTARLQQRLKSEQMRIDGIAELVAETDRAALTVEDLGEVRSEIADSLSRLEVLEDRALAGQRVISTAAQSVVFLQGSYGFVEKESGKPLRFVVGPDGAPLFDPSGTPGITTDGEGPVLESMFTGTAFVATDDGLLLTNRHVAVPWEYDEAARMIAAQGLVPTLFRFVGYLKDVEEPFEVELVAPSDAADVAVLKCSEVTGHVAPLPLAEASPLPGEEVIVLGYPTGIRALLARSDVAFVNELMASGDVDFWGVARRLAEAGYIAPLATRGFVGQVTPAAVVYDAETTSGGSGGPVINLAGEVIAVNAAILPEFGGSNLGVPISFARELLASPEEEAGYAPSADFPTP